MAAYPRRLERGCRRYRVEWQHRAIAQIAKIGHEQHREPKFEGRHEPVKPKRSRDYKADEIFEIKTRLARLEAAAKKNATKDDKANGDGNWQRLKRSFGTSDRAAGIEDRGIRNAFRVLRMQRDLA
jgi:hypothetical protein